MNVPIYHNSDARNELIALIDKSKTPLRGKCKDIETMINSLIETAISGCDADMVKNVVRYRGALIEAEYYAGHEEQDYIYINYYYNTEMSTVGDKWVLFTPLNEEPVDPLLITGMIADEGF